MSPAGVQTAVSEAGDLHLGYRLLIAVALAVTVLHAWDWEALRYVTSEASLRFSGAIGMPMQRISFDTVEWRGQAFMFTAGCTFVHVYAACLPLLWTRRRSVGRNVMTLAAYAPCFFVLNVWRLALGDVMYSIGRGVPWEWTHQIATGVAYFVAWLMIFEWHRPASARGR